MENCIPEFWEREREWKNSFPTFGNGNGNEKLIPKLWEREWEAGIPGNGREREFPLTPGGGVRGGVGKRPDFFRFLFCAPFPNIEY